MDETEPGPMERWRVEDTNRIECPLCGYDTITDDRMGNHLFWEHWGTIETVANSNRENLKKQLDEAFINEVSASMDFGDESRDSPEDEDEEVEASQELEEHRGLIQEIIDEDRELLDRLADAKDLFYGDGTLAHETDGEWSGCLEIEAWSNEPDDHEIPTVLLEGWNARADQDQGEFEINLNPGYARGLGVELVKRADEAEDIARTVEENDESG
jgi:hypothetical protein